MAQLSQLFYFTSFSPAKAFVGKLLNVVSTFLWSFTDLFVMVVSLGLSSRFKQINDSLMRHKGMVYVELYFYRYSIEVKYLVLVSVDA